MCRVSQFTQVTVKLLPRGDTLSDPVTVLVATNFATSWPTDCILLQVVDVMAVQKCLKNILRVWAGHFGHFWIKQFRQLPTCSFCSVLFCSVLFLFVLFCIFTTMKIESYLSLVTTLCHQVKAGSWRNCTNRNFYPVLIIYYLHTSRHVKTKWLLKSLLHSATYWISSCRFLHIRKCNMWVGVLLQSQLLQVWMKTIIDIEHSTICKGN